DHKLGDGVLSALAKAPMERMADAERVVVRREPLRLFDYQGLRARLDNSAGDPLLARSTPGHGEGAGGGGNRNLVCGTSGLLIVAPRRRTPSALRTNLDLQRKRLDLADRTQFSVRPGQSLQIRLSVYPRPGRTS